MTDEEIRQITASAPVSKETIEIIELSASWFTRKYYLQRQVTDDIEVVLETGETVTANYAPMSLNQSSNNADLNYERNIIIQQVNDIIAEEQSRYDPDIHDNEFPMFISRGYVLYRNGDISQIKQQPIRLPIRKMRRDERGALFNVTTKPANQSATGEVCTVTRAPMTKGFL
jgi:hypothetical protein